MADKAPLAPAFSIGSSLIPLVSSIFATLASLLFLKQPKHDFASEILACSSLCKECSTHCTLTWLALWPHWDVCVSCTAAASESLQSCPTLCDPIDGSPSGSPVPGILQARTLEWVAISFSSAWKWKVKVKLLSCVRLPETPWIAAYQAPPSMGFSRQEYWSGVPLPSPVSCTIGSQILFSLDNSYSLSCFIFLPCTYLYVTSYCLYIRFVYCFLQ